MLLGFLLGNFSLGYGANVIDFGVRPYSSSPVVGNAYATYILVYRNIIDFSAIDNWNFSIQGVGGSSGGSTGPLQFIFNGNSYTDGHVNAYNDGIINVSLFNVHARYPIVEACRRILSTVGLVGGKYAARPYKLDIIRNGVILFTIRSIYWGSQMSISETQPNYEIIDNQTQASNSD